jgi:hypothetical protein
MARLEGSHIYQTAWRDVTDVMLARPAALRVDRADSDIIFGTELPV